MGTKPQTDLGLSLIRATESTAMVASRWVGRGNLITADQVASEMMRHKLDRINMSGQIVIGERPQHVDVAVLGEGTNVGTGLGPTMDVAVDSIEGVRLLAEGLPDAISVAALAPYGAMYTPLPVPYMEKFVVSEIGAQVLTPQCFDAPVAWTLGVLSRALRKNVEDLTVFVLNRPRHELLIYDIRATGARVILRSEGDVVGAILAATPGSAIDIMMGIGGSTEGVVAACAVRAMSGAMLTRLVAETETQRTALDAAGLSEYQVFSQNDLVTSDEIFFAATGITDGLLIPGVRYHKRGATTHSLELNGRSRVRRQIEADHHDDTIEQMSV
ncbi:fructose-bisphosphatase class II family protein [Anaerolineales bacterium HSG6]|nr:fructose-bisphosphatase class II family protein [Anaerolineales bacterium HSG6]MDM8532575.1 fructose-bisphosphatase class II family protein [Anaerolineales bacterium HSG25]